MSMNLLWIPNAFSISRMAGTIGLLLLPPFSFCFWILYGWCGFSDIADGYLARRFHAQSALGQRLDSIADLLLTGCLLFLVVQHIVLPFWVWACAMAVGGIRLTAYGVGFCKSIHTWSNKATGVLLFLAPLWLQVADIPAIGILVCCTAGFSACEELFFIWSGQGPDRDCQGFWRIKKW